MHEPTIHDNGLVEFDGVIIGRIHHPTGGIFEGLWYAQYLTNETSIPRSDGSPEQCARWLVTRYTHNSSVNDVKAYVRALQTSHDYDVDLEQLNDRTMSLYVTVLADITSGAADPRGLARAALGAKAAEFSRYVRD